MLSTMADPQVGEESGYGLFMAPDTHNMRSARRRWWWPFGAPPPFTTVATFPLSSCLTAENILADPQVGIVEVAYPLLPLPLQDWMRLSLAAQENWILPSECMLTLSMAHMRLYSRQVNAYVDSQHGPHAPVLAPSECIC